MGTHRPLYHHYPWNILIWYGDAMPTPVLPGVIYIHTYIYKHIHTYIRIRAYVNAGHCGASMSEYGDNLELLQNYRTQKCVMSD